jgi:hypothetical protein
MFHGTGFLTNLLYKTPFAGLVLPQYNYLFTPAQLGFLIESLTSTKDVPGNVIEVGCHQGRTTLLLCKHLDCLQSAKTYYALDTFDGFTPRDLAFEIDHRGKHPGLRSQFRDTRKAWFDAAMRLGNASRVRSIQADAGSFDFSQLGPLSFALLDVDLYQPIKATLRGIWPLMAPGGLVIVDDCQASDYYDGALVAYTEFCEESRTASNICHDRLGLWQKP